MKFALSFLVIVVMAALLTVGIVKMATGTLWILPLVLAAFFFLFIRYGCLGH